MQLESIQDVLTRVNIASILLRRGLSLHTKKGILQGDNHPPFWIMKWNLFKSKERTETKRAVQKRIEQAEHYRKETIAQAQKLVQQLRERSISYSEYTTQLQRRFGESSAQEWVDYYTNYQKAGESILAKIERKEKINVLFSIFLIATLAIILALSFYSFTEKPTLTGLSVQEITQTYTQQINTTFEDSDTLKLELENKGILTAVRISGYAQGTGDIKILLENNILYTSSPQTASPITGSAIEEIQNETETLTTNIETNETNPKNETTFNETENNETIPIIKTENRTEPENEIPIRHFEKACIETCDLKSLKLNQTSYTLTIEISGEAKLYIESIQYDILSQKEIINLTNETRENITEENITNATILSLVQQPARIGEPVRWIKRIQKNADERTAIKIPASAENIQVKKEENEAKKETKFEQRETKITGSIIKIQENSSSFMQRLRNLFRITGSSIIETNTSTEVQIEIILNETQENRTTEEIYEILYETPAPTITEKNLSLTSKQVTISSPDDIRYENVTSFTTIPELLKVNGKGKVKLLWENNEKIEHSFTLLDTNNNSYYDLIEWIIPHLSNQTFEIILITRAAHLDKDRLFLTDITEQVKRQDDIWSEEIQNKEYIRVTFEKNLTTENDITIFPRTIQGNPKLNVYEINKTEIIATFDNLESDKYNKILLTSLQTQQDTFDLEVTGGSIILDHIIDPHAELIIGDKQTLCGEVTAYDKIVINASGILAICTRNATIPSGFANITLGNNGNFTLYASGKIEGNLTGAAGGAGCNGNSCRGTQGTNGYNWTAGSSNSPNNIANGGGGGGGNRTANSVSSGGGGAGFGGAGGIGGEQPNDATSTAGNGGGTYGSSADNRTLVAGSGGGGSAADTARTGGSGGGGIKINASSGEIVIVGSINFTGGQGVGGAAADEGSGGGGSGGHIILIADRVTLASAAIEARGGAGGPASGTTDSCGGGGGGGGRILVVYGSSSSNTSTTANVSGGAVGASVACDATPLGGSEGTNFITATGFADVESPNVTLLIPTNNTVVANITTFFQAHLKDNKNVSNATLYVWNSTDLVGTNTTTLAKNTSISANISFTLPRDGIYFWNFEAVDNTSNSAIRNDTNFTITLLEFLSPNVTLLVPTNNTNALTNTTFFQADFVDEKNVSNVTLYVWNSTDLVGTNFTALGNRSISANISFTLPREDTYLWNFLGVDNSSNQKFNNTNFTLRFTDTTLPTTNLLVPTNNTTVTTNLSFFQTQIIDNKNVSNATLYVWNSSNLVGTNTTTPLGNASISANISFTLPRFDTYFWNFLGVDNSSNQAFNNSNLTLVFSDTTPIITFVSNITAQSVTENSVKLVEINLTVYDADGFGLINMSTAIVSVNRTGETTRSNTTCLNTANYASFYTNLTCTISMQYFDGAGGWTINATIKDNSSSVAQNLSINFTLSESTCIVLAPKSLTWPEIILGSTDTLSTNDPVVINNTCNDDIASGNVRVKAIDMYGETDPLTRIFAANFTVNVADTCNTGTAMVNGTLTGVTSSILEAGNNSINNGTSGQEQLYLCIEAINSDLTQQSYSTAVAGQWEISVLTALFITQRRNKKRRNKPQRFEQLSRRKQKQILENLSALDRFVQERFEIDLETLTKQALQEEKTREEKVPLSIFKTEVSPAEALCKYLKENRSMNFAEIARHIQRDQRTVWINYRNACAKQAKQLQIDKTQPDIKLTIFANRNTTIFESLILELREQGLSNATIAQQLKKDPRNIWTVYSRAVRKIKGKL